MKRTLALLAFTAASYSPVACAQGTGSQETLPDSPPSHRPAPPDPAWNRLARLHAGDSIAVLNLSGTSPVSCQLVSVSADTVTCVG